MATTKVATASHGNLTAAKRRALVDGLEREREAMLNLYRHDLKVGKKAVDEGSEDLVDHANRANDQALMLALSDTERSTVWEIDEALDRIEKGSYGVCAHCQAPIGEPRLKAVPWARYCIVCQERDEKGLLDG